MTEKPNETPKEELECPKKYVYDTGIIFECKDNIRVEIIGEDVVDLLNELATKCSKLEKENEQLKKDIKRYRDWINSDKNDYELTLSFIKNKGYSLKDVLEYEKEVKKDD